MQSEVKTETGIIGVVSDTHGMFRPEVSSILKGVDMIVHAGDIGSVDVLKSLETIAPVTAVSGNTDGGILTTLLNDTETFEFHSFKFHLLHDLSHLSIDPATSGIQLVISGHSHLPEVRKANGVIYLNPGSAGPKRLNKPISLAKVTVSSGRLIVKHFKL
jgi:putative phosphoesterase